MNREINMVSCSHQAFNQPDGDPTLINNKDFTDLREKLIREESLELFDELRSGKITPNLLKEGADLLYVVFGLFAGLGLDWQLREAFHRVHESNMSKLGPDGKPIHREDGKVMKGPNYLPPNLEGLL